MSQLKWGESARIFFFFFFFKSGKQNRVINPWIPWIQAEGLSRKQYWARWIRIWTRINKFSTMVGGPWRVWPIRHPQQPTVPSLARQHSSLVWPWTVKPGENQWTIVEMTWVTTIRIYIMQMSLQVRCSFQIFQHVFLQTIYCRIQTSFKGTGHGDNRGLNSCYCCEWAFLSVWLM